MTTITEAVNAALEEAAQKAFCHDLGTPDGHSIGNAILAMKLPAEPAPIQSAELAELRKLAEGVPEHIRLKGWLVAAPAFGQQHVYADDFRGMGRQHIASLPASKEYFGTLPNFIAAANPAVILRLLDALAAAPSIASQRQVSAGEWISVDERLPVQKVLATYTPLGGRTRTIVAFHAARFTIEAFGDDCYSEVNDEDDTEYLREGWYECIENWGDFSSVHVNAGEVTHWMPLPAAPVAPHQESAA